MQATNMIPCSDEEYYYKIDNMVLSSTQHLRSIFKNRYKTETGKDWIDDMNHIEHFFDGVGKQIMRKALPNQKNRLMTVIEDWDMSLLWVVIKNFGIEDQYVKENAAVEKLKNMRNDLAHHTTKKITESEYMENIKVFENCLQDLKMDNQKIRKLVDRAGVTSSVKAFESVTVLLKKADEFLQAGEVDKAAECYTEATQMPSLLPVNLGITFEKRAEYYLSLVKDSFMDKDHCSKAFLDISKALELNDSSWMAHFLAAKCYRLKSDLSQAIHHYQRALAISPAQRQVKDDLNSCKVLYGMHEREDHRNPELMPRSLQEELAEHEEKTGRRLSEADVKKMIRKRETGKSGIPGDDHVIRGHKHFGGWGVPPNPTEGAKHYAKAAKLKNTTGMYHLAWCYHNGYGVNQDVKEALRIYKELADMDNKTPGETTLLKFNLAIANAQHALGLMYQDGIGVDIDNTEAAMWYQRAMENGCGGAANNLGLLYIDGRGVPRDGKMAEMCWKQAVNLKSDQAPASLVAYYFQEMEPEKAIEMLSVGREMGNHALKNVSDGEFLRTAMIKQSQRDDVEGSLKTFEESHKLEAKGFTFQQRLTRQHHYKNPNLAKLKTIVESMEHRDLGSNRDAEGNIQPITWKTIVAVEKRAMEGSETAQNIMETLIFASELIGLLEGAREHTEYQQIKILNLVYNCVRQDLHILPSIMEESWQKLKSVLADMFEKKCEKKAEEDMKIRLCYVAISLSGSVTSTDMYAVEVLKEGVRRYPENVHYYDLLSWLLAAKKMFEEGLAYAEKGLKICPNHPDLLYNRALNIYNSTSSRSSDECISALKEFISKAPYDHRKVPEAFYKISSSYMNQFGNFESASGLDMSETFFKRGEEAEKNRLPCYPPFMDADAKRLVPNFIDGVKNKLEEICKDNERPSCPKKQSQSIVERKPFLKSPVRKALILEHREKMKEILQRGSNFSVISIAPKFTQPAPKKMTGMLPITFNEMNPTKDHIFEGRMIDLTILEDPVFFPKSIHMIVEDENGDVTRLVVYEDKSKQTVEKFGAGCRITILNPYMRLGGLDGVNTLRNDETKCIIPLDKLSQMCRYCGAENASHRCVKCARPYCSKECQQRDWKELQHKIICSLKVKV